MRADVTTYGSAHLRPTTPLASASGTVWYANANATSIIPFQTATHTFAKPLPNPTAIPGFGYAAPPNTHAQLALAPRALAQGTGRTLWGVGTAEMRSGFSGYASTYAIVEYDRAGSSRAFPIPDGYVPGYLTVESPNGKPWSMIWTDRGTTAAVVQLHANGTVTPKFTVARSALPRQYRLRYARFGKAGIVWLLGNRFPHPQITRWVLGSRNPTRIALPVDGYLRCEAFTTSPDGSAWVIGKAVTAAGRGSTYFYRISPAGAVRRFALDVPNEQTSCPATIFAAHGSLWGVSIVSNGPGVGTAYLLRVDASGKVAQTEIAGPRGSIAQIGPSIPGRGDEAYMSSFSGDLPVLHYTP